MVTGSANVFLDDYSYLLLAKALAQTTLSINWAVSDGTGGLGVFLPNIRITGELPNRPGPDQDVMFSFNYTALYDATEVSSITLTRGAV